MKFSNINVAEIRNGLFSLAVMVACSPAFAQMEKPKQLLTTMQFWILAISGSLITIALMFVGIRMAFQAAQWKDVAPVFWGACIVGSAAGVATMLVG